MIRSPVLSINVVRQKHCLDLFGFEMAVQKLSQASRQERYQLADLALSDATKSFSYSQQLQNSLQPCDAHLRWRLQKKWLQITRKFLELSIQAKKSLGIANREAPDLFGSSFAICPPPYDPPIGKRNLQKRVARHHAQPKRC